jgi:hypothetical protein
MTTNVSNEDVMSACVSLGKGYAQGPKTRKEIQAQLRVTGMRPEYAAVVLAVVDALRLDPDAKPSRLRRLAAAMKEQWVEEVEP